jgi:hypothetical protein
MLRLSLFIRFSLARAQPKRHEFGVPILDEIHGTAVLARVRNRAPLTLGNLLSDRHLASGSPPEASRTMACHSGNGSRPQ